MHLVEEEMNREEENFLKELRLFHLQVEEFNKQKSDLQAKSVHREHGLFALNTAIAINRYQGILEQRAKNAQNTLSTPIDDNKELQKIVQELEQTIDLNRKKLKTEFQNEDLESIEKIRLEVNDIEENNRIIDIKNQERKMQLEHDMKQLEFEEQALNENIQKEDKIIEDVEKTFDAFQKEHQHIIEEHARRDKKKKVLHQKQETINNEKNKLNTEKKDFNNFCLKCEKELEAMKNQNDEISKKNEAINQILLSKDDELKKKTFLEQKLTDLENEFAKMKHRFEIQEADLDKLQEKENKHKKLLKQLEDKQKSIDEKRIAIESRKVELEQMNIDISQDKAQLDFEKGKAQQLDSDVKEIELHIKETIKKAQNIQDQIEREAFNKSQQMSSQQLEDIQKVLSTTLSS